MLREYLLLELTLMILDINVEAGLKLGNVVRANGPAVGRRREYCCSGEDCCSTGEDCCCAETAADDWRRTRKRLLLTTGEDCCFAEKDREEEGKTLPLYSLSV
ncbi:hypothetical protein SESBI_44912 [Sesbania bispinosa]|nr:hypothetical protein SESBI_44912 [Sesbania bispinosa]